MSIYREILHAIHVNAYDPYKSSYTSLHAYLGFGLVFNELLLSTGIEKVLCILLAGSWRQMLLVPVLTSCSASAFFSLHLIVEHVSSFCLIRG